MRDADFCRVRRRNRPAYRGVPLLLRANNDRAKRARPKSTSDPLSEWLAGASRLEVRTDSVTSDAPAIAVDVRVRFNISESLKESDAL